MLRVSSVWCKNLYSGESSSRLRKCFANFRVFIKIFEKTCILLDFVCISQMYIFHEKIITFLLVTLLHMVGFGSNFYRRREIQLPYWICTLKCPMTPFPRIFLLKTWIFHCTQTSKNWKIHDFFCVFSFVLILFSKSKIVRRTRFCGF